MPVTSEQTRYTQNPCRCCVSPVVDFINQLITDNETGENKRTQNDIADMANGYFEQVVGREPGEDEAISRIMIRNHTVKGHYKYGRMLEMAIEETDEIKERVKTETPTVREALNLIIGIGAQNLIATPGKVTPSHVLQAMKLLFAMDKTTGGEDEFAEAIQEQREKEFDGVSPLGSALEAREDALAKGKGKGGRSN